MQKRIWSRLLKAGLVAIGLAILAGWCVRLVGETRLAVARERFEEQVGPLNLAAYVLPKVEDADNAAVWLRAGAEKLEISEVGAAAMADILDQPEETWSQDTVIEAVALLETNREALATMRRCSGLRDSSFGFEYELGFSAATPPMLDLYRAGILTAMICVWRSQLESASGPSTISRSWISCHALSGVSPFYSRH